MINESELKERFKVIGKQQEEFGQDLRQILAKHGLIYKPFDASIIVTDALDRLVKAYISAARKQGTAEDNPTLISLNIISEHMDDCRKEIGILNREFYKEQE